MHRCAGLGLRRQLDLVARSVSTYLDGQRRRARLAVLPPAYDHLVPVGIAHLRVERDRGPRRADQRSALPYAHVRCVVRRAVGGLHRPLQASGEIVLGVPAPARRRPIRAGTPVGTAVDGGVVRPAGGVAVDGTLPPAPPAPSGVLPAAQPVGDEQREVRGVTLGDPCTRRLRVCPDPVSPLLELGGTQSAEPEVVLVVETGGHLL